jgi:hypothetical protein
MREKPGGPPLSIVSSSPTIPIPPGCELGEHGAALWARVQTEFRISDVGGIELLMQCCLASDRAEALRARIDEDGETIHTKMGLKAHPCLKDEIAARSFIVRTLERLGVTLEPLKPVGHPLHSGGWRGPHAD